MAPLRRCRLFSAAANPDPTLTQTQTLSPTLTLTRTVILHPGSPRRRLRLRRGGAQRLDCLCLQCRGWPPRGMQAALRRGRRPCDRARQSCRCVDQTRTHTPVCCVASVSQRCLDPSNQASCRQGLRWFLLECLALTGQMAGMRGPSRWRARRSRPCTCSTISTISWLCTRQQTPRARRQHPRVHGAACDGSQRLATQQPPSRGLRRSQRTNGSTLRPSFVEGRSRPSAGHERQSSSRSPTNRTARMRATALLRKVSSPRSPSRSSVVARRTRQIAQPHRLCVHPIEHHLNLHLERGTLDRPFLPHSSQYAMRPCA